MISVPAAFRLATIAREGEAGRRWIETLPATIGELLERWRLRADGTLMHGYIGVVLPVRRGTEEYVLKVSWQDRWSAHEALALQTWAGCGAVALVDHAPAEGALLLERADASHSLERAPIDAAIEVAGTLLRRLAVAAPSGVRTFAEELHTVATDLRHGWSAFGRPFPKRLLVRALTAAEAEHSDRNTLVNTDLHYGNILRATREPWLAIDPKVLTGELEYGTAQLLWSRFEEMGGAPGFRRRFSALVAAAGLDAQRVHLWAMVRILDYWLWALGQGFTEAPGRCRQLIEWLIEHERQLTARST